MDENFKTKGPSQLRSLLEVSEITTSPDLGHGLADKKVETSNNKNVVKEQHGKQSRAL